MTSETNLSHIVEGKTVNHAVKKNEIPQDIQSFTWLYQNSSI